MPRNGEEARVSRRGASARGQASAGRVQARGEGRGRAKVTVEPEASAPEGWPNGVAWRSGASHSLIELEFLRGLLEAVDRSSIDTLEIVRAGTRIRISKTPSPPPVVAPLAAAPPVVAGAPALGVAGGAPPAAPAAPPAGGGAAGEGAAQAEAPAAAGAEAPERKLVEVRSPMVGTFYRAPAPEAPPYVEVGSHVTKGQTLCILEAMKLMNELESEVDGIVREILVENAEPVEYGQVLFRIEPTNDRG